MVEPKAAASLLSVRKDECQLDGSIRGHARTVIRHSTSARTVSEGRGRAKRLGLPVFRPHEQTAENDRDEKESGHVTEQVSAMLSGHRLNRHDAAVHDPRPECE